MIALSLPLFCRIEVVPQSESRIICLQIPALDKSVRYDLDTLPPRQDANTKEPDFALAALHEAVDDGWSFAHGANCVSTVDLPMKAGCSTSSAFTVAWIQILAVLANQSLTPLQLAERAHQAEVTHYKAPGGTMDHITSAVGGLLRIGPGAFQVEALPLLDGDDESLGFWVLAYSGEPKDTMRHLKRCKDARITLLEKLGGDWDGDGGTCSLSNDELELLRTTRINKDMESTAFEAWKTGRTDDDSSPIGRKLGSLMMRHHEALRDGLGLSTDVLEAMNVAAMEAGAWGFKVVGSGGGGCGVAWTCSANAEIVAQAMENAGAVRTCIIRRASCGAYIEYDRGAGT